jgi:hypothetical protein
MHTDTRIRGRNIRTSLETVKGFIIPDTAQPGRDTTYINHEHCRILLMLAAPGAGFRIKKTGSVGILVQFSLVFLKTVQTL